MKELESRDGKFILSGDIDSAIADEFYRAVMLDYQQNPRDLVFLCENLNFLDSTTLGTFVKIRKELQKNEHRLILRGLQPKIKKLFIICNLDAILELE